MKTSCSILVLNYNGQRLLAQFLESVLIAANRSRICSIQVMLVDNQSADESIYWTKRYLPEVAVLRAPNNRYLYSLNWAAQQVDSKVLVLLNNDIEMTEDCLDPMFEILLADSRVFSVTPQLLGMDRITPNGGRHHGRFHRGMLLTTLANEGTSPTATLFGCGGAMAVRRQDFLELGGFDELYYPAYWEDVDLSYKAWKRGRTNIYQPASVMYHVHSASWKADPIRQAQMSTVSFRNCWLFTWRNISAPSVLRSNIYWTARHYTSSLRLGNQQIHRMYHEAFSKWRQAVAASKQDEAQRVWSDETILQLVSGVAAV